jgi:hypothetical protein
MNSKTTETHKVQFSFSKQALNDLDELKENIDAPTRAETIRYALRLLQWTIDEMKQGHKLCLETDEGISQVMIPFLSNSLKSAAKGA